MHKGMCERFFLYILKDNKNWSNIDKKPQYDRNQLWYTRWR